MPQHDVIALNADFDDWRRNRLSGLSGIEPFLYYTVENITKRFNLTDEEVQYGITDHPHDGGVDAIYFIAGKKNVLLRDDVETPTGNVDSIRIMVFQAKSSLSETGFSPPEIDKLAHFSDDLLNFSDVDLAGKYVDRLVTRIETFKDKYRQYARHFPRLILEFYYVTRGDEESLTVPAKAAVERLRETVTKHRGTLSEDEFRFEPVDTVRLLQFVRQRRQFPRTITWSQQPMPVDNGYVGMVRLVNYYEFLKNDDGDLDELIFESNVRGNQGRSSVNRQMRKALDESKHPDFWQLNNGITITCSRIDPIDAYKLEIHDAQVVNGLQTSRQIFGHFKEARNGPSNDERLVLVKLLPVTDDAVRDTIIRATNNQNAMKAAALRATDERQRDIEALFKQYGYFYDRRPGYWKDQGKKIAQIVSLNEIVQAMVAVVLHRPDDARGKPGTYIKEGKEGDAKYRQVFGSSRRESRPLPIFLKTVLLVRAVKEFLGNMDDLTPGHRTNLLFYVAYHAVCELAHTAAPSVADILNIELGALNDAQLERSVTIVNSTYQKLIDTVDDNPDNVAKGRDFLDEVRGELKAQYGSNPQVVQPQKKQRVKELLQDSLIK